MRWADAAWAQDQKHPGHNDRDRATKKTLPSCSGVGGGVTLVCDEVSFLQAQVIFSLQMVEKSHVGSVLVLAYSPA